MAISEAYSGTEAVGTTEHSLTADAAYSGATPITTDGVYQVFLDVSDMVAEDVLQIRIYEKCRSGDTQRVVYQAILGGVQAQPIWVSPSLVLMHGWDVTLDKLDGSGNTATILWSIRSVA